MNGLINHNYHYSEKLIAQYEARLKDKDDLIALLKEEIDNLKQKIK